MYSLYTSRPTIMIPELGDPWLDRGSLIPCRLSMRQTLGVLEGSAMAWEFNAVLMYEAYNYIPKVKSWRMLEGVPDGPLFENRFAINFYRL